MYLIKTGCQWRMLPKDFGPWQTVYFYFRKWKFEGVFEELMHFLRRVVRQVEGKEISPSIGIIDSRSVRTSHHIDGKEYGIDGGKKMKGRKEHIIVDTLELPMAVRVHAANIHNSVGVVDMIRLLRYQFSRLKKIIVDGGYRGKLTDRVKKYLGWELSLMFRPNELSKKFRALSLRWIVEQTFSWLENYKRRWTPKWHRQNRVQIFNSQNKRMIKFNTIDGKIMDIKQKLSIKFKGVRKMHKKSRIDIIRMLT